MTSLLKINNLLGLAVLFAQSTVAANIKDMRVEYQTEPLAVDVKQPRFSWQMKTDDTRHGQHQKAWRIVVCDEDGNPVWNSGKRKSDRSVGISYAGKALEPVTRYTWQLTVWDERGKMSTDTSTFETGLMDMEHWSDAHWIGSGTDELPLYAPYLPVFRLSYTVSFDWKSNTDRASFIYGANDVRLMDGNKNILGMAASRDSSYIRVELDASADTSRINIYRTGYSERDRADVPLASFRVPVSLINTKNRYMPHTVSISSVLGTTYCYLDGDKRPLGKVELNPMGRGGDFIAFPVLGDYGFCVPKGQMARFTNVCVNNYRSPSNLIKTLVADTLVASSVVKTKRIEGHSEPLLRTDFSVDKTVKKARLYVTARGTYQFFINGRRVGDDFLNPGSTQFNKTHFYQTYDVTALLRNGRNAMGAQLAEGWWSGGVTFVGENWNAFGDTHSLLAKLIVTYTDGTKRQVVTNPQTWQVYTHGPLVCGSLFQGEVYDGVKSASLSGWSEPGYDASQWLEASEVPLMGRVADTGNSDMPAPDDYSGFNLTAQVGPTVQAVDTLSALSVEEVRPGVFVYDMGQNMAGVPMIELDGLPRNTQLTFRFAEVTYPALPQYADNTGMIMLENIRAAMAQDIYVANGGRETFIPCFTYHGYRYIEVTGLNRALPLQNVKSLVLSSVHRFTSDYTTSDSLVNRLWQNVKWSMQSNFFSVPTDCPQRNERMGWSGDISVFSPTATYLSDVDQFLYRHTMAMRDVQRTDGKFLDIAPVGAGFGGLLWGSAGIIVPWQCWLQYEDSVVLEENYVAMCKYIDFVKKNTIDPKTGVIVQSRKWGDLADWLSPEDGKNDPSLLWEAYYIYDLDLMTKIANILGHHEDANRFKLMASERRMFFNKTYLQKGTAKTVWSNYNDKKHGQFVDTQVSYVLPLAFNIVADSVKDRFIENLCNTVSRSSVDHSSYALLTGFIGTAWISKVLSDNGCSDLAYRLLLNRDYPSWLYPVTQGATSVWERLDSYTHQAGFGKNNRMNSFNHYSFGAVAQWLMDGSLGIRRDENSPAFKHFILSPQPDPTRTLTHAEGHYDSMYGRIESSWRRVGDDVNYEFTIPANTTATLVLKGQKNKELKSGKYKLTVK